MYKATTFVSFAFAIQIAALIFGAHANHDGKTTIPYRLRGGPRTYYQCMTTLDYCLRYVDEKIYNYEGAERVEALNQLGAEQFCVYAAAAGSCVLDAIEHCPEQNPSYTAPYAAEAKTYNYLCTQKYEEISEHWDCFTSPEVLRGYFECKKQHEITTADSDCDNDVNVAQCIMNIAAQTEACSPEAATSATNIVTIITHYDQEANPVERPASCKANTKWADL